MRFKKLSAVLLAAAFTFGVSSGTEAAMRGELAEISLSKAAQSGNFKYWEKNAPAKDKIIEYVRDVTNRKSPHFIPPDERIAVFSLDGTLMHGAEPTYFERLMYVRRALHDPTYVPSKNDNDCAQAVEAAIKKGQLPDDVADKEAASQAAVFAGLTLEEYDDYVRDFMQTKVEGFTNLKRGEAFYLPMVETVAYLAAHDFIVCLVSGSDRAMLRVLVDGVMDIKKNNIIGTDTEILANNQGEKDSLDYAYDKKDYLVRGKLLRENAQLNKVSAIAREIGQRPVLAFGSSPNDASMLEYTVAGNKYRSEAFVLLADDAVRELGDWDKAAKMTRSATENGWNTISMRDDFQTIYGENVEREKS